MSDSQDSKSQDGNVDVGQESQDSQNENVSDSSNEMEAKPKKPRATAGRYVRKQAPAQKDGSGGSESSFSDWSSKETDIGESYDEGEEDLDEIAPDEAF